MAETWLGNVWVTSDPTRRGSEIHGLVDSALNDLQEALVDGDAQHVWEEASESLTAEIVGLFDNDRSDQTRPEREQVREANGSPIGPVDPVAGLLHEAWEFRRTYGHLPTMRPYTELVRRLAEALLASSRPPAQANPLSEAAEKNIAYARELVDELAAGHPQYQGIERDDLEAWQKEQVTFWAMNLQGVLARCVPSLLDSIDRLRASSLSVPQQGEVLWEGESLRRERPGASRHSSFIYAELPDRPPGTRVRVVPEERSDG